METMVYVVKITFADKNIKENDVLNFINEKLDDIEVVNIKNNYVEIKWDMCAEEGGPHEIEETLYYILEDDTLGTYDYERIK